MASATRPTSRHVNGQDDCSSRVPQRRRSRRTASATWRGVGRGRTAHDQDGTARGPQDAERDAAEQGAGDGAVATRADDDHIDGDRRPRRPRSRRRSSHRGVRSWPPRRALRRRRRRPPAGRDHVRWVRAAGRHRCRRPRTRVPGRGRARRARRSAPSGASQPSRPPARWRPTTRRTRPWRRGPSGAWPTPRAAGPERHSRMPIVAVTSERHRGRPLSCASRDRWSQRPGSRVLISWSSQPLPSGSPNDTNEA